MKTIFLELSVKKLEIPSEACREGIPLPSQVDSKKFSAAAKVTLHRLCTEAFNELIPHTLHKNDLFENRAAEC